MLRKLGVVALVLADLLLVAVVVSALWLRSRPGRAFLLETLLQAAAPPDGELVIDSLETDLLSTATLHGVSLRDAEGRELIGADQVTVEFRLGGIFGKVLRVTHADVKGLRADLAIEDDGLDLVRLWGPAPTAPAAPSGPYSGLPIDLLVDSLTADATRVSLREGDNVWALTDARLAGAVTFRGDTIDVSAVELVAPGTEPALGPLALRGDLRYDPRSLRTEGLDLTLGP